MRAYLSVRASSAASPPLLPTNGHRPFGVRQNHLDDRIPSMHRNGRTHVSAQVMHDNTPIRMSFPQNIDMCMNVYSVDVEKICHTPCMTQMKTLRRTRRAQGMRPDTHGNACRGIRSFAYRHACGQRICFCACLRSAVVANNCGACVSVDDEQDAHHNHHAYSVVSRPHPMHASVQQRRLFQ